MKKNILMTWTVLAFHSLAGGIFLPAQVGTQNPNNNFYEKSLHYTNRGLEYWYSKENGGLERITGIPFSKINCGKCHARTCDTCHVKEANGKPVYSVDTAKSEKTCEKCHDIESLAFARKNPGNATVDVHFAKGMRCMDCHSVREIHGDGSLYDSIQAAGALETNCEKCHTDLSKCPSNAVHNGKVDCSACHVRDLPSCYNCHLDTRIKEGKSVSIPLKNMLFLVNHDGKVTPASLHTFVYQNKTMIVFAPSFPHSIMREGRKCVDCHATTLLQNIRTGLFKPVLWENGALKNAKGVIPVVEGLKWNFVFLNYIAGRWAPLEKAAEPLLNYSGYCRPITKEQLAKLAKPQSSKS